MSRPRRSELGLSTIEVLVAVALIGMAMLPLVVIQSQVANSHARLQDSYRRATLQMNALEVVRELNPARSPQGEIEFDENYTLQWSSTAISEQTRIIDYPIGDGSFDVGLYQVDIVVRGVLGNIELSFATEKVGWSAVGGLAAAN